MDRISTFISYSSQEKNIGGKFKACLEKYCGYVAFIAHEDIEGSTIWGDEIIKAVELTDFFIPLLSEKFRISDFTDQETGMAVALKKKIIPIKLESTNPYGFIDKYQALQYKSYSSISSPEDNIKELALTIAQIGLRYELCHEKAINSLVHAFCNSKSFEATNATINILSKYDHFSKNHLKQIMFAIQNNSQVKGAYGLPNFKKFLHSRYGIILD